MSKCIKDIMSSDIRSLPYKTKVSVACSLFWQEGIKHIPITDDNGAVIGMFSMTDAMKMFNEKIYRNPTLTREAIDEMLSIGDFMTSKDIKSISENKSLSKACKSMQKHGINSLLVYRAHNLVGIVTSGDLKKEGIEVRSVA